MRLPAPGKPGLFLAKDMTDHLFTGWERVFAAYINEEIAGYCTLARKDCIPDVPYSPYIGYMFVDEKYRGRRLSQKLIQCAMPMPGNWVSQGSILSVGKKDCMKNMDLPN